MVLEFLLVIGLLTEAFIWNRMFKSQYGFLSHHFFHLMPCLVSCVGSDISFLCNYIRRYQKCRGHEEVAGDSSSSQQLVFSLSLLQKVAWYTLHTEPVFFLLTWSTKRKQVWLLFMFPIGMVFCLPCAPPQVFYFLFSWSLNINYMPKCSGFDFVLLIV